MAKGKFIIRDDCRFFKGDLPCRRGALCASCRDYERIGKKILVIKLGAMGDVLRTTPILPELRKKHGPCHVTWIVDAASAPLLKGNRYIDRIVVYGPEAIARIAVEKFDLVACFDKHPGAAALATMAKARSKIGFILDADTGAIGFAGKSCEYAYRLGLDDDLKFRGNKKTYQRITFEMLGLAWKKQPYIFDLSDDSIRRGREILASIRFAKKGPVIGLVTGAGDVWPMKRWGVKSFAKLADKLVREKSARVMLLGAERDKARNVEIRDAASIKHPLAPHDMSILEFAGLLNACDMIVTGDTVAMHIGVALGVPTVALFGPTSIDEVEMYDAGVAVAPKVDCAPCYRTSCDESPTCMDSITVDDVVKALDAATKKRSRSR